MIDSKSAMLAGIIAATAATAAEILLWWATGAPLTDTLVRDARLAAAIVLSERVLAPTPLFDWGVMTAATLVHFGLSILYAIALAVIIGGLGVAAAIATGVAFGGLLYLVNMYGFTFVFPWFVATRDWITFAAHLVFGATAGGVYAVVRRRSIGVR